MNYKDTLNLPKTGFSMKANLAKLEPEILSVWQKLDIYSYLRQERKGQDKYILHDGPPYANGLIHIGHALNKILKDIVIKYKILRGFDCPFIIGWDCHGLPVEHQLFKELKLTKHDVNIGDFRLKAKDYALKFVELQSEDFKRLGVFADWDNPYLTLDPNYEHSVMKLLEELVAKGYIYRGRKPVNWCASCETALAEAEVEYADKESDSTYLLFAVDDDKGMLKGKVQGPVYFLVWTTTPWTLVSNVAVAVHPEFKYSLIELNGKRVFVAQELIPTLEGKLKTKVEISQTYTGKDLEGLVLAHPFLNRNSKVVLADFVSSEEGSGCVHIAPGHGQEDFSLVKKYSLEVIMPLDDKGIFLEPDQFKGKNINQASSAVLEILESKGSLVKHNRIKHSYPHCWRCKQPVIFRATYQWFFKVDHQDLRNKALAETERVNWVPESGKERMKSMLTVRPDWCLSRQRLWGVPIPAVRCRKCQEVVLSDKVIATVAKVFKEKGSDSWFKLSADKFIPKNLTCPKCNNKDFDKEFDILDVWFESGASFLAVLERLKELRFPADLYLEGSDQHRGWFQVSLIPSVAKQKQAPFKTILTHGFVVDGEGKKMSKSLGNVIAPQKIIKDYGAEILRLWTAYSDYSEDVKISPEIIKQLVDMYRKVRNTIRFILGNIDDFDLKRDSLAYDQLLEVDRYMLSRSLSIFKEGLNNYDQFRFYKVCQTIFNFCNLELSSFYLDILKDRLYTFSQNSRERRSAQFVLYHILDLLIKLIAPILSFTAEEVYSAWGNKLDKKDSIFSAPIDLSHYKGWLDEPLEERWQKIASLRVKVLKEIEVQREAGLVGSSLEAEVKIVCPKEDYQVYYQSQDLLREVFIVSEVNLEEGIPLIEVTKAKGDKCQRCWNFSTSVGKDSDHSTICERCLRSLKED
ncbi:MAG: isoleucine--tRNA ligase [Candidatus Omnitrophica bacterium]|nr:isoleucine--tRNA ligase [Candidatus Omnitrophota bacterium]